MDSIDSIQFLFWVRVFVEGVDLLLMEEFWFRWV